MRTPLLGLIVAAATLGTVACKDTPPAKDAAPAAQAAAPAAAPAEAPPAAAPKGRRVLTDSQRQAMLEKLDIRGGTPRRVWFATVPNPEVADFQKQIQAVFEEAGWTVAGNERVTFGLKPGIFFFMAEEEPPEYLQHVSDAFEAADIEIMAGRGYREYYNEKKKENPSWNGFELKPDQDFILVIGRQAAE